MQNSFFCSVWNFLLLYNVLLDLSQQQAISRLKSVNVSIFFRKEAIVSTLIV